MLSYLEIDLAAFTANLAFLADTIKPAELMLVVKNDAYGHGLLPIVKAASGSGVRHFGAFDIDTAVAVADICDDDSLVFAWDIPDIKDIERALAAGIHLGIGDSGYLKRVVQTVEVNGVTGLVHLKIDTGLHRNGFRAEDWGSALEYAEEARQRGLLKIMGVWSHIAEVSPESDEISRQEFLQAWERLGAITPKSAGALRHLSASAAGFSRPKFRYDMVRFGAFSYGIRSAGDSLPNGLTPIATLRSHVVQLEAGLAWIPLGYLDGIPQALSGRITVGTPAGPAQVLCVKSDRMGLQAWPGATIGDPVAVFGPGTQGESDATSLGEALDSIGEEILLRISPGIPRTYLGE